MVFTNGLSSIGYVPTSLVVHDTWLNMFPILVVFDTWLNVFPMLVVFDTRIKCVSYIGGS